MILKAKKNETPSGGNIVIIGPRSSGKTTLLAGLAYWPKRREAQQQQGIYHVQPLNDDARKLEADAENILMPKDSFQGSQVPVGGVIELPTYSFQIQVKKELINLVAKDYAGEVFDELDNGSTKAVHTEMLEECFMEDKAGCLLLLHGWQPYDDQAYSRKLKIFLNLLTQSNRTRNFRLAIAMSKCERGELWTGRIEPEIDIFRFRLPQCKQALETVFNKRNENEHNLSYFAISTFGVLEHNNPIPNRINLLKQYEMLEENQVAAVLRSPAAWKPYNLIAPLYWLSTGKRMKANV